jgi:RNA polymerase sigma-70 factor (ECF subfamily)
MTEIANLAREKLFPVDGKGLGEVADPPISLVWWVELETIEALPSYAVTEGHGATSRSWMDVGLTPPTDAELIARVAQGDSRALEELYNRYSQSVFSMSYSLLRDYSAAEDVTQEVFVSLWTRASKFDPERGVFRHWFLHMAHNRVIDELRRRKRASQYSSDKVPEDAELALESPANTADQAITSVLFGEAAEALKSLPDEQRTAVVMAYIDGATQQEIAKRTDVPLGTVKTRLRLGLIKLRHLLSQPANEEA